MFAPTYEGVLTAIETISPEHITTKLRSMIQTQSLFVICQYDFATPDFFSAIEKFKSSSCMNFDSILFEEEKKECCTLEERLPYRLTKWKKGVVNDKEFVFVFAFEMKTNSRNDVILYFSLLRLDLDDLPKASQILPAKE